MPSFLNIQGIIGGILSLVLAGFLVHAELDARHWHKQSDQWEQKYQAEVNAYAQAVAHYQAAAVEAQRINDSQVKARLDQYRAADEKVKNDLQAKIANLRALAASAGGLRPAFADAGGSQSRPSGSTASPAPAPPCRATDPSWVCVPASVILRGAENEAHHDALIDWAEEVEKAIAP